MELTKQQFIDRFTHAEFIGILTAAKTDIEVEGWLFRFNNADSPMDTTSQTVVDGLALLVTEGLLTQARADEIAGTTLSWDGWSVGQIVRVLPPFTQSFPNTYALIAIDPVAPALTIEGGAQFAPQYLEVV